MNALQDITPEIAEFRRQSILRDKLATLLEDPTMKLAIKAVLSMGVPRAVPQQVPGVHHDTTIAHTFYNHLGVVKAMNALQFLTTDGGRLGDQQGPDEDEFVHGIDPSLRQEPEEVKARRESSKQPPRPAARGKKR